MAGQPRKNTDTKSKQLANLTGKGRPKGVPNKLTTAAKDAIAFAADKLGGAERLAGWAAEDPANEAIFWSRIYPKLIPLDVNHAGTLNVTLKAQRDAAVAAAARAAT